MFSCYPLVLEHINPSAARWHRGDSDGDTRHAVLSTERFEHRYACGYQGIHIHTRHAMRHDDGPRQDAGDWHCWHPQGRARGVEEYLAALRYTQSHQICRGQPGHAVTVAVVYRPM